MPWLSNTHFRSSCCFGGHSRESPIVPERATNWPPVQRANPHNTPPTLHRSIYTEQNQLGGVYSTTQKRNAFVRLLRRRSNKANSSVGRFNRRISCSIARGKFSVLFVCVHWMCRIRTCLLRWFIRLLVKVSARWVRKLLFVCAAVRAESTMLVQMEEMCKMRNGGSCPQYVWFPCGMPKDAACLEYPHSSPFYICERVCSVQLLSPMIIRHMSACLFVWLYIIYTIYT